MAPTTLVHISGLDADSLLSVTIQGPGGGNHWASVHRTVKKSGISACGAFMEPTVLQGVIRPLSFRSRWESTRSFGITRASECDCIDELPLVCPPQPSTKVGKRCLTPKSKCPIGTLDGLHAPHNSLGALDYEQRYY